VSHADSSAPVLVSPALSLIRDAMASDTVSPEKLRAILDVKKDWEADEARKAFNRAISDFQKNAPIVEKGDDANGKAYAAIDRIWRTVSPLLTQLGLSVTWQVSEIRDVQPLGLACHLEGMLRHRDGHGEKLTFDIPVPDAITNRDGKPVQNKAQVVSSANTYARRYCLCAALGIVTGEDDDGNGGALTTIDVDEQKAIKDQLDAWRGVASWTKEREEVFWRFVNVPTLASGNHDLAKLPMARLADVLDLLKRSIAGAKKS
jgi:ERF superfamily